MARKPVVYIDMKAWRKMLAYTDIVKDEVSGLGEVEVFKGDFYIDDLHLIRQFSGPGSVALDQAHIAELITQKIKEGDTTFSARLRCWWHTHPDFNVFMSTTDTDTIERLGIRTPWVVAICTNRKREVHARLDIFEPVQTTIENLELVPSELSGKFVAQCKADVARLVRPFPPIVSSPWQSPYAKDGYWDNTQHRWVTFAEANARATIELTSKIPLGGNYELVRDPNNPRSWRMSKIVPKEVIPVYAKGTPPTPPLFEYPPYIEKKSTETPVSVPLTPINGDPKKDETKEIDASDLHKMFNEI